MRYKPKMYMRNSNSTKFEPTIWTSDARTGTSVVMRVLFEQDGKACTQGIWIGPDCGGSISMFDGRNASSRVCLRMRKLPSHDRYTCGTDFVEDAGTQTPVVLKAAQNMCEVFLSNLPYSKSGLPKYISVASLTKNYAQILMQRMVETNRKVVRDET